MSAQKVEQLRALLSRVERRRAEPRLVAMARPLESANTNVAMPGPRAAEGESLPSIEAAPPPVASSMPPPAPGATARSSLVSPLPPRNEPLPARPKTASSIPPAEPATLPPRAPTEVLSPIPTRVAPSAPLSFDSAVRVASSPRIDTPKTFGELLELSLSLRPK